VNTIGTSGTILPTDNTLQTLEAALEQIDYGVAITDTNGIIQYVNPPFVKLQDTSFQPQTGALFPMLEPNTNRAEEIKAEIVKNNIWRHEFSFTPENMDKQWRSIRISPLYEGNHQVTHFVISTFDTLHRVQSRQQLAEQHEQLQLLFNKVESSKREWEWSLDCINDVVILVDQDDIVLRINKAVETLFDLKIAASLGKNWRILLPEGLASQAHLPREGQFHDKVRDKCFQFHIFPFNETSIKTEVAQIVTLHDTSAMWQLNNDLTEAYEQMKSAQGQMLNQEKMASIGQLAAGVAHEINNPTGFIASNLTSLAKYTRRFNDHIEFLEGQLEQLGNADAIAAAQQHKKELKLKVIQEDVGYLIEESLEGAERIKVIVQNLKSFSRVDDSAACVSNIHQCLDAALSIGWNEIKYKATVTKDYQEIPEIYCSAQQLNQVFLNILVNASQAMKDHGEIVIHTSTQEPWVVISISDNGNGIDPKILSKIFEPFFTTKDVGKGTGLGLSICYDIIQKHHGELTATSEVGVGTTFTIKLPIITQKQED
jgi:two-component system NtrC family sensor kinase